MLAFRLIYARFLILRAKAAMQHSLLLRLKSYRLEERVKAMGFSPAKLMKRMPR